MRRQVALILPVMIPMALPASHFKISYFFAL